MIFHEGMGPRRSMVQELTDTIIFGDLCRIKDACRTRKVKTTTGDCYVVPFGRSKDTYGAILVHALKRIEIVYRENGKDRKNLCRNLYDAKRFLIVKFVQI